MPRPRNAFPARRLTTAIPGELAARLDLLLYSSAEQRVPFGAYQRYFVERLQEYFDRDALDLSDFTAQLPRGSKVVFGTPAAIAALKEILGRK